jgi:transcriptional regulator with XRE-family HTH domain
MGSPFRGRPADVGHARANYLRHRFGDELRVARAATGLSQALLARRAGVTQAFVSAVERGARAATLDAACRLAAAAGCEVSVKIFPGDGVPLRDSGQLALAEALVAAAHPSCHARLEVPVSDTDRRAADLVLEGADEVLHIEIERRLSDAQAQLRAATLKRAALAKRSALPVRLILALPDRRSTRRLVRELAPLLTRALPVRSDRIRRAIVRGGQVGGDGILFVPERAPQNLA